MATYTQATSQCSPAEGAERGGARFRLHRAQIAIILPTEQGEHSGGPALPSPSPQRSNPCTCCQMAYQKTPDGGACTRSCTLHQLVLHVARARHPAIALSVMSPSRCEMLGQSSRSVVLHITGRRLLTHRADRAWRCRQCKTSLTAEECSLRHYSNQQMLTSGALQTTIHQAVSLLSLKKRAFDTRIPAEGLSACRCPRSWQLSLGECAQRFLFCFLLSSFRLAPEQ